MDYFSRGSVIAAGFLVGAMLLLVLPGAARGATTQAQAYATCKNISLQLPSGTQWSCEPIYQTPPARNYYQLVWADPRQNPPTPHPADSDKRAFWDIDAPPFGCSSLPTVAHNFPGRLFNGYNFPQTAKDPVTGMSTQCTMVLSACTPPTYDPNHSQWMTYCTAAPSGGTSGGPGWNDGVGPTSGIPGPPDTPLAPEPPPPKICNGVSCYDPGQDKFCAGVEGGGQVCVPGGSGRSPQGACASSGGSTLCGGAPQAPVPPPAQVPDPPGQINGSGSITQGTPPPAGGGGQGGGVVVVHTATYGQPGSSANDGAGAGDSSPAPPSSSGGAGSFGGGGSCETPPACTGDAVLCGIARTQWATTCQIHKDLAGTGPAPSVTSGVAGDVWVDGSAGTGDAVADNANKGIYDQSGFGGSRACPLNDMTVTFQGQSIAVPFSRGCEPLNWLSYLVVGFALFSASKITMGAR